MCFSFIGTLTNNGFGHHTSLARNIDLLFLQTPSLFHHYPLTFSQTTNLDSSKLNKFADNNIRFDENGRNFLKWVENTVGKGEIACYEQFLISQCFQKTCTADM